MDYDRKRDYKLIGNDNIGCNIDCNIGFKRFDAGFKTSVTCACTSTGDKKTARY